MSATSSSSSPSQGSSFADRFEGAKDLLKAWRNGMRQDPALTVSQWADKHRVLSPRGASEAGPWRTDRTPYLREIMDALSPSRPIQRVVFMKGAQLGGTEAGNNWIGYVVHHAPGPMLAVQPTVELAKRFSQQRIDPLIEASPSLRERVSPARSRDSGNTVLSKEFPAGILVMTGANSAVGLRSMPARYLFLDEVDAYPPSADEEGDPVPQQSFGVQLLDAAKDKNMAPWLVGWVFLWFALLDFVSGITRPLITWSVFGCYAAYRYAWFLMTLSYSQTWQQAFVQSWGDFDQALLQMVLSYWFGERVRKAVFGGNASHGGAGK
jgi:hypothetical protein